MPSNRQQIMMIFIVLLAGVLLFVTLRSAIVQKTYEEKALTEPIGYRMVVDGCEGVGRGHLVSAAIWSNRDAEIVRVEILYRQKGQDDFLSVPMQLVGTDDRWVGELPALSMGESYSYYITAIDGAGASVSIPPSAPQEPLLRTRWESPVNPWVQLLYLTLMIGAAVFLLHGVYYVLLILFGRMGELAQKATASRAHQSVRWGWLTLFVAGIVLSTYLHGAALGVGRGWGGWPPGHNFADIRTEVLLLFFGIILLVRWDLFRFSPTRLRKPRFSNAIFGWLVLAGAILTLLLYCFPPRLFVQTGV
ncbi:MAG: hypothetical protein B1H03_02155 [Planctomycetales bacterium 4484_113]|nr:MAG: hypothetical protein B1H03_02155 [Planctomycetales bacterium 4484_113]